MDFVQLVQLILGILAALAGFPALLSLVLTALEFWGWLSPERVDAVNFFANAIVFVGLFVLGIMGKLDLVEAIDAALGQLAQILTLVLILLGVPVGFAFTKLIHEPIRTATFLQR